jgi:hypothetical protein
MFRSRCGDSCLYEWKIGGGMAFQAKGEGRLDLDERGFSHSTDVYHLTYWEIAITGG